MNFIFINGLPASGKDTQAWLLKEDLPNSVLISPGEIYRDMRDPKSPYHEYLDIAAPYLNKVDMGEIVPEEVTMHIVTSLVDKYESEGIKNFIFTGFPRTIEQLDMMDDYAHFIREEWGEEVSQMHIDYAVLPSLAIKRAEGRRKSEEAKRSDDEMQVVQHRIEVYKKEGSTSDMLHELAREKRLKIIRGDRSIEDVQAKTKEVIESFAGSPERR